MGGILYNPVSGGLPLGLTGATAPTRYVGRFDGSAPTSGTFAVGDFTIDATTPAVWVCETAGSPGSWGEVGGGAGAVSSVTNVDGSITFAPTTGAVVGSVAAVAQSKVTGLAAALALLAPLASPTFTGTVTAAALTATGAITFNANAIAQSMVNGLAASLAAAGPPTSGTGITVTGVSVAITSVAPTLESSGWNVAVTNGTVATHSHGAKLDPSGMGMACTSGDLFAGGASTAWPTNNTAIYTKCPYGSASVTNFNFIVGIQSGNMDIGIYANSGAGAAAVPGTQTAHKGSTAVPVAGNITMAVGTVNTMVQGANWFAYAFDNSTATVDRTTLTGAFFGTGTNMSQATAFPLTTASGTTGNIFGTATYTS